MKQSLIDLAPVFRPPWRERGLGQRVHLWVTLLNSPLYVPGTQGNALFDNSGQKWPAGQGAERDVQVFNIPTLITT